MGDEHTHVSGEARIDIAHQRTLYGGQTGCGPVPVAAALYSWLLVGLKGQTLGKMVVRIRVVDKSGNVPGLRRALLREIVGKLVIGFVLPALIATFTVGLSVITVPGLGCLWIARSQNKQGWHDTMADTFVVMKARRPLQPEEGEALPTATGTNKGG